MDASDGADISGKRIPPDPVSLPSAVVPVGGPVSSSDASTGAAATPSEKPAAPPVKRNAKGQFPKGTSGNPRGNHKRTPNLNGQLIKALKTFTLTDNQGQKHTFLEALIKRALAEPQVMAKLLDKVFVDVTPPPEPTKVEVHNSNGIQQTENHVAIGQLLSDAEGREALALLAERLEARGVFSGGDGARN